MAKNKKVVEDVEVIEPDKVNETDSDTDTKVVKDDKKTAKDNKKSQKNNNKTEKKSIGKKGKEIYSELKKVSWPSFGKVVKSTCVVIVVVAICTLLLFGIDMLLQLVYDLLLPSA